MGCGLRKPILDEPAGRISSEDQHDISSQLDLIHKDRDETPVEAEEEGPENVLLGDFFEFGDFCVPTQMDILTPRQPPKKSEKFTKSGTGKRSHLTKKGLTISRNAQDQPVFKFGDFSVAMDDLDNEMGTTKVAKPQDDIFTPPEKQVERKISNYTQYNLLGHSTRVKCIAIAPNEQYYVSCSNEDTAIVMYDILLGKEILSFFGHEDTIISACFSLDSKFLATTSRDNTMILWDAVIGQQISVFDHEKVVICCCFSRDGKFLVSGCQDKVCRKWDIRKRREVLAYSDHEGIIVSVSFAPDGEHICSAAADKTLKIWNSVTGTTIRTLRGHKGIVLSCTYSQDGLNIVSNDETVMKVWDVPTGECLTSLEVSNLLQSGKRNTAKKLAWTLSTYSPGQFGFYVVAVCNDRVVHIFHPITGKEVLSFYSKAPVYCLSSGFDCKMAFGDSYGNIYIVILN